MRDPSIERDERRALEALAAAGGPAWIVDTVAARILAQNPAGHQLLGLGLDPLDSAMPAIVRLRRLARQDASRDGTLHPLVFWTEKGARSVDCTVDRLTRQGAANDAIPAHGSGLLLVTAAAGADPPLPDTRSELPVEEPAGAMDDAATLRQIALRIKQGTAALAAASGAHPVTPAAPTISASLVREPPADESAPHAPAGASPRPDAPARSRTKPAQDEPSTIAKLAHELKTPLSAIAAASEIMKDERLGAIGNERYRDYAADIHDGARHALAVIGRMLDDAGCGTEIEGPALQFTAVDLNSLAESCVALMRPLAQAQQLRLECDLAPELGKLTADATSLRQILLNLLTNAVKFARPGDVVRLATRASTHGSTLIEVSDTGPGMSRADITAALDPQHARPFTPRDGGGMGIGLPLVRSMVESNAGCLSIESPPGRGTVVTITFPRKRLIAV